MPIASQTDTQPATSHRSVPTERRRDALLALLAAFANAPHPALWVWLAPCGFCLSSTRGRRR